jgi:chromatin remodeling complex protein RSC6
MPAAANNANNNNNNASAEQTNNSNSNGKGRGRTRNAVVQDKDAVVESVEVSMSPQVTLAVSDVVSAAVGTVGTVGTVAAATETGLVQYLLDVNANIKEIGALLSRLGGNMKLLGREVQRVNKTKNRKIRKGSSCNLVKQHVVSDELNAFFGKEVGTVWRRADITRAINEYAKNENLKAPDNKRVVIVNPALAGLLADPARTDSPKDGSRVELFSMLAHLKRHVLGNATVCEGGGGGGECPMDIVGGVDGHNDIAAVEAQQAVPEGIAA